MAGALTASIAAIFSGSAVTADPYFEYTTLLLTGNGTNGAQNNTFLDSSTNNFTITRNGNTTQGTFSPFSQTGWGNFFGTSNYLTIANSVDLQFGTGDFTISAWIYLLSTSPEQSICSKGTASTGWAFNLNSSGKLMWLDNGVHTAATTVATNTWHYVVCSRVGSTIRIFLNGTQDLSVTLSTNYNQTNSFLVSLSRDGQWPLNGYISNLKVVKGTGVTSVTVPTTPDTATSGTSLLTCNSNRFIDANTQASAKSITVNGSPRVVAFSPFSPTASWSAATYGGSGYFDGSGDYLQTTSTSTIGTNPYTIEFWVNLAASGDESYMFGQIATQTPVVIYQSGVLKLVRAFHSDVLTYTVTLVPFAWYHIAVVRNSSNTISMYLNGSRVATGTDATNYTTASTYIAGGRGQPFASEYLTGHLSDCRFVIGSAVYDPTQTTLTVPTAPLTAITNTSLLLNYTNAGIYDATSKNDLETVGNAQISTTQSKWGGSSISFDGTGDWLLIPDQPPQRIGTGKFTVELWVYRNSSGTYGLVGKGSSTTGWLVSLNSSNQVVFTYGSSTITSTGTVSATTWTHIAVVREGTSTNQTKIYINGTNDGTGTVSTDFNQTNSMYIGANRTGGSAANAYVQDVRITNDARYTANFTAPTAAFPTL